MKIKHIRHIITILVLVGLLPIISYGDLSQKQNHPGVVYWHGDPTQKKVSLTFDDGPNATYTPQILKILKEYNIQATFFMLGKNVESYPDIAKEVAESGNVIGNHSYTHKNLIFDLNPYVRRQIIRSQSRILENTGITPLLFRPPYGGDDPFTVNQTKKLGYVMVKWSVSSKDWERPGVSKIINNVLKNTKNGSIILMHDGDRLLTKVDRSQTVEALPTIITNIQRQGYQFVTLPDLLELKK